MNQTEEGDFDAFWKALTKDQILTYLGGITRSITCRSGNSYSVNNLEDLIAVVEQELYDDKEKN
tara:strand:- start:304 stop:495 length:192 start_codon:yes stop_codon:yes gene_type:complete